MKKKLFQVAGSCLLILLFAAVAAESASSTQASSPSTAPGAAQTVTCDFSCAKLGSTRARPGGD